MDNNKTNPAKSKTYPASSKTNLANNKTHSENKVNPENGKINSENKTISRIPLTFVSYDKKSQINALIWEPEELAFTPVSASAPSAEAPTSTHACTPRGIVQIVHGMSEHIERYDNFARFLAARGYVVCAHDHIGHGKSVKHPSQLGHLPLSCGKEALVEDVNTLRNLVRERYAANAPSATNAPSAAKDPFAANDPCAAQTPYFLFGHSMGSFIARVYIARYAQGLKGAIICGTGNTPRALSKAGNFLARRIASRQGEEIRSETLDSLGAGGFAKKIKNARTNLDWLSTDDVVVDAYIADEACGAMFSAGGYAALTSLTYEAALPSTAAKIPHELPLYFIAGESDPVGNFGKGVQAAANLAKRSGVEDVEVKIYPGMRHEILNEPDHAQVYEDIAMWMADHESAREATPATTTPTTSTSN